MTAEPAVETDIQPGQLWEFCRTDSAGTVLYHYVVLVLRQDGEFQAGYPRWRCMYVTESRHSGPVTHSSWTLGNPSSGYWWRQISAV